MNKIYPKTCENLSGEHNLREFIKKYEGVEIQYFHKSQERIIDFEIEKPIEKIMKINPEIKEITIHPPLDNYNIEQVIMEGKDLLFKLINDVLTLSKEYNIKINMVFHHSLSFQGHKYCTIDTLKEGLKLLEGSNVQILLENLFMFYETGLCTELQVCKEIDNEHLKMCVDVCHLYCRAKILDMTIEEFLKTYLDKELCRKYVYQIHFADTKNNDGYIKKETHGRGYDSVEKIKYNLDLLKEYGIEDKIIVTEVSEDDYSQRLDQVKTIRLIETINLSREKITIEYVSFN